MRPDVSNGGVARTIALTGPLYLVIAMAAAAGLDGDAKFLGTTYPIGEITWFRHAIHVAVAVAIFGPSMRRRLFRTSHLRLQLARSCLLLATTVLFFTSLRFLPLAESTAVIQVAPLITVGLASPLLGERVTRRSAVAVFVGFLGVLAVVQPFSGGFGPAVLLPLLGALTSSLYRILTRMIGDRDTAATTLFYTGIVGSVAMLATVPSGWVAPASPSDLGLLLLLGVLGGAAHFLLIKAYQRAPAAVLAPLHYLELAFATLIGLFLFAELPNTLALFGMGLIAAAGILASRRRPVAPVELMA